MRVLCLDLGERRIGVAISDPMGWTAQGVESYNYKGDEDLMRHILQLITDKQAEKLVIGMPRNMNGTYGPMSEKIKAFANGFAPVCPVPIVLWDERLTTVAAQRTLLEGNVRRDKRRQVVDKLAACLILQNYLEANP